MPRPPRKFNPHPVFWLAASLAAGILVARLTRVPAGTDVTAALLLAVLAVVFRRRVSGRILVFVAFAAAGAGVYNAELIRENAPDRLRVMYDSGAVASRSGVEIEGVITGSAEESLNGQFITLRVDRLRSEDVDRNASGNVRLF